MNTKGSKPKSSARLRLDLLKAHPDYIAGDPEDLVHLDWSGAWPPDFFRQTFGGWEGEPLERPPQGTPEKRHDLK